MKLIKGDSYVELKKIPSESVDLVIIDPPYFFANGGGGGAFGTEKRAYHRGINSLDTTITREKQKYIDYIKENGKNDTAEAKKLRINANKSEQRKSLKPFSTGIDNEILEELCRVMKKNNIYIWCNKKQLQQYINFFSKKGCNIDLLTWHKTNPIPTCNNTYLSDTEYLLFAREKGTRIYGTYETKRKYYVTKCNIEDKKKWNHPTIKPLNIIENLIINSSLSGGLSLIVLWVVAQQELLVSI